MNNQKKLKNYTNLFIDVLSPYLKKGFQLSATIHPAIGEGAIIEFEINEGKRSNITFNSARQTINEVLENIDQRLIGGNIQGLRFGGTNLYMEGQRIIIIKGEDDQEQWSNKAVIDDVNRVVSPRKGGA